MGSEPVCPECLCVIDSDTGCACPDTTTCTICGTRVEGVGVEHQRECNGALWRTRAHAAERRAAVLAALLGCARGVLAELRALREGTHSSRVVPRDADSDWPLRDGRALFYLATNPHELMRLVPETRPIIETALGAAGLTIEDLDVLEETT